MQVIQVRIGIGLTKIGNLQRVDRSDLECNTEDIEQQQVAALPPIFIP